MLTVQKLRVEYKENPVGLDVRFPRISWQLQSVERDVLQQSYEIEVSVEADFRRILWSSGRVYSEQSAHVELAELLPGSRQRYYYRVRVWDTENRGTEWSEPAFWEMGLLAQEDWQAEWISAPLSLLGVEAERCPLLRGSFQAAAKPLKARMYATALGLYELELNGLRVGDGYLTPGWTSYSQRLQVQAYDITAQIAAGDNAVGAWLGNGWYKGNLAWDNRRHIFGSRTALLMQIHLTYEDGSEQIFATGENWTAAAGPILMSELYHGETYDARLELSGFSQPGYDDSGWSRVELLPHSKEILVAQENVPVRKIDQIKPLNLLKTPAGETVLDMGQNMVGWMQFCLTAPRGQQVELVHFEVLDRDGNVYTDNLRSARQKITYIAKGGGRESYEPRFTFQGFRYVQLTGFGEELSPENFTGIVLHSDMEHTGSFACSNPLINQLQHNILWGQKGNFVDVPTDCPQRDERLGWTGDAQMFIRTSAYLMNVAPFFSKWLKDLSADQLEHGGVPFVIPDVLGENDHSSAAWGDAAVICPWTLYQCYGDKRILEQQYPSMRGWVEYIRKQGQDEYLWNTGVHFGDWLGLDAKQDSYKGATDTDLIATAFYAYSVQLLQKTADVLGRTDEAKQYMVLYSRIKEAFNREFITPSGRLSVPTQTACVLALMFGLVEGPAKARTTDKLLKLLEESGHHLTTGFVGTPYLNLVLSEAGHTDAAYKLLLQTDYPSWLYQVTKGATTIWEHWDGIKEDGSFWSKNMNSFNHYAYGAIGDFLYRHIAGIELDEAHPGYKEFVIKPQPGGDLTWAAAALETMYGRIRSEWSITSNQMELSVSVPPNTSAALYLPNAGLPRVLEGDVHLEQAIGVHSAEQLEHEVKVMLGSGDYRFIYELGAMS
ncbi:family 78 glycoside hydrolase catalytic domain [Paenibacillus graminis]|uniref:family 78 glycoside hydrolase catalytic domain n=1 Tax=Paenibacillus graminis TaxID=189425 RepID=UPI002DB56DFA|nr:family 78 glycoside hydrolase catalytic domain [Paenibacillus graminis]MEC0169071.1 family 78 glycoside hydrolase catalytic domain [Paenibacillus graminis]